MEVRGSKERGWGGVGEDVVGRIGGMQAVSVTGVRER